MKDNLIKKFFLFSYGSWIGLIIGFVTTMITTRILPPDYFGKASMYNLAITVLMIFIIFGTDQSFVRFFYEEHSDKRGGLLYNCIKIPIIVSLLIIPVVILFSTQILNYLIGTNSISLTVAFVTSILFNVISRYAVLVIRMDQKSNLFSIIEILRRISDLVSMIVLYFFIGKKIEIVIYSSLLTLILVTIIAINYAKEYWNPKNSKIPTLKHNLTDIFTYASPLVLTSLISWLFTSFDKIALKQWSTFTEIGLYSAAFKIVALLLVLQGSFTTFWTPVCYEKFEKDPNDLVFFERTSRIISIAMFSLAILSIVGKDLIIFLLGNEYREASNIMPFLVFMPIMYTISETTVIGINFYKVPKWHLLISTVSCIANIMGNWILVPTFGAKGAAIATAIAYILFFTLRTQISLRYYPVNYGLKKLYTMTILIFMYALYATFTMNFLVNLIIGVMLFVSMVIIYRKDVYWSGEYILTIINKNRKK